MSYTNTDEEGAMVYWCGTGWYSEDYHSKLNNWKLITNTMQSLCPEKSNFKVNELYTIHIH
jgi:hypothetical protein